MKTIISFFKAPLGYLKSMTSRARMFQTEGAAEVRSLDFPRWYGSGVLHTKMLLVDGKHFYVGSANFDWRSLTQVKELGTALYNCTCIAEDMQKIFDVYWFMGKPNQTLPHGWPKNYSTPFNRLTPLHIQMNNTRTAVYLASSPPEFCPAGRTSDIDAILDVITKARNFIYVAVMDYFPTTLYTYPSRFWPVIDDALRRASLERGVEIRIMASWWNHSNPDMVKYLNSLAALSGAMKAKVSVKLFQVPSYTAAQSQIPFARVNHNKYMVTDNTAYIGTSNWSGDYFINTGGIGLVINQPALENTDDTVQQQLVDIFLRDWNSSFAHPIDS
ncbi:5'-3' exonuclease PLD3 [Lamellibrachia satsuma]|nr:5'-3' exonuclease PLD3 [Lamellibrachia satsuma]